jgi:hypothetical protein
MLGPLCSLLGALGLFLSMEERELDELWVSYLQLNDPIGLNQISLECERLLRMVQEN